ncbi:MAG: hypothetical protein P9M14_05430 [Candidatus Alcyoniella australis]|nr:hypothetical protein [Candidatus Alcyoniella australis]
MQKHGMATAFPKLSLRTLAKDWHKIIAALLMNKVWISGLGAMALGSIVFVYTTSIGDISVIQPLTNINGIVAVLIGVFLLKERVQSIELVGVMLLVGGALVVGFSSEASTAGQANESMLLMLTAVTVVLLVLGFVVFGLGSRLGGGSWSALIMAFIAGVGFGCANLFVKVLTESTKEGGEAMQLNGAVLVDLLTSYHIYALLVVVIIGSVAFQLGCSHGRIAVIQPTTTVFSNIMPVAGGWLVFGELMNPGKIVGIVIIVIGTLLLALGKPEEPVSSITQNCSP